MADRTSVEWTRSDDGTPGATWNPVTGCTEVGTPGCDHCYAKVFAERWRGTPGHYFDRGFDVVLRPDKLGLPLRWRRPRRIFVNSLSDLSVGVSSMSGGTSAGQRRHSGVRQVLRTCLVGAAT